MTPKNRSLRKLICIEWGKIYYYEDYSWLQDKKYRAVKNNVLNWRKAVFINKWESRQLSWQIWEGDANLGGNLWKEELKKEDKGIVKYPKQAGNSQRTFILQMCKLINYRNHLKLGYYNKEEI